VKLLHLLAPVVVTVLVALALVAGFLLWLAGDTRGALLCGLVALGGLGVLAIIDLFELPKGPRS